MSHSQITQSVGPLIDHLIYSLGLVYQLSIVLIFFDKTTKFLRRSDNQCISSFKSSFFIQLNITKLDSTYYVPKQAYFV